jgi:hypothetical protein
MANQFGQVGVGVVAIGTSVANAAVNVQHAIKTGKMQRKFQKRVGTDQANLDYLKNIILRFKSLGNRLVTTKAIQPGTPAFEDALKRATVNEMIYRGNCNANIYTPRSSNDAIGQPRALIGKFTRAGHIESTILPKDAGPVWASGCKNAQDSFRYSFVNKYKGGRQFRRLKTQKEDIGTTDLFLRFGSGLFIAAVLLLAIKTQSKVIKTQKTI